MSARPLPRRRGLPALVLLLGLAACATPQDFDRPGTWQATGANDANLRAMLVDPAHAARGVAAPTERGQPATLAVTRLERDRRRPLPATNASRVGVPLFNVPSAEAANGR